MKNAWCRQNYTGVQFSIVFCVFHPWAKHKKTFKNLGKQCFKNVISKFGKNCVPTFSLAQKTHRNMLEQNWKCGFNFLKKIMLNFALYVIWRTKSLEVDLTKKKKFWVAFFLLCDLGSNNFTIFSGVQKYV